MKEWLDSQRKKELYCREKTASEYVGGVGMGSFVINKIFFDQGISKLLDDTAQNTHCSGWTG